MPERPIFTDYVPLSMMISYLTSTSDSMSLRLLAGLFGPPSCGWLDIFYDFSGLIFLQIYNATSLFE
jgi:hypothetical protein